MSISSIIINQLNQPQKEAVTTINGPLQVIAGAGSGKTRVLVYRIAHLIENGVNPDNILSLTFTNKAANEMKTRISQLIDSDSANRIWAGTFHSICARILRREAHNLGYDSSFSIYDTEDSLRIIKKLQESIGFNDKQYSHKAIYSAISDAKNKLIYAKEYTNSATSKFEKNVAEIYRLYQEHLLENNAMDFDDLICNTVELFGLQETLHKYQNKFKYILVDEYQDTNRVQYVVVNKLAAHHQNLCVVGDDAQSIYKWRGAEIQNILDFEKDYPYCKKIKLEQNYRSTKNILKAAGSVIAKNKKQLHKNLWTDNEDGDLIQLIKFPDDKVEATTIVKTIKQAVDSGHKLNDFAVLYRTNAQSLAFENACRLSNLPYTVIGGMSFYKRKEIKDVIAYLHVLLNPQDSNSLLRIINEPPRGIGATSIESFSAYAAKNKLSLFSAIFQSEAVHDVINRQKVIATINNLSTVFSKYTELAKNPAETDYLFDYIEDTGLFAFYREIDSEEAHDRLANIEQLLNDVVSYIREVPGRTLQSYIEQASLISDLDYKDLSEEKLTLMTVHSAKGLEFDNIFIPGMEENLFPLMRADNDNCDEEEERRLFYVGITRARKALALTYTAKRLKFGKLYHNKHSKFLTEIEPEVINDIYDNTFLATKKKVSFTQYTNPTNTIDRSQKPKYPAFNDLNYNDNYSQIPNEESQGYNAYRVGDIVKHSTFGIGKILSISGIADSKKAVVHFNTVGRKNLILQYAKLEKQ